MPTKESERRAQEFNALIGEIPEQGGLKIPYPNEVLNDNTFDKFAWHVRNRVTAPQGRIAIAELTSIDGQQMAWVRLVPSANPVERKASNITTQETNEPVTSGDTAIAVNFEPTKGSERLIPKVLEPHLNHSIDDLRGTVGDTTIAALEDYITHQGISLEELLRIVGDRHLIAGQSINRIHASLQQLGLTISLPTFRKTLKALGFKATEKGKSSIRSIRNSALSEFENIDDWVTNNALAKKLDIDPKTLKSFASRYYDTHPQSFKTLKFNDEIEYTSYSPDLVTTLEEEVSQFRRNISNQGVRRTEVRNRILQYIYAQILEHKTNSGDIETIEEIAQKFGVSKSMVQFYVLEFLDDDEREYRANQIRQNMQRRWYLNSINSQQFCI